MKNAKKVFAMLIVLALAISMAIPVSAAGYTITITNTTPGQTYNVYKLATLKYDAENDAYAYYVESAWETFLEGKGFKVDDNKDKLLTYNGTMPSKDAFQAVAGAAAGALNGKTPVATGTVAAGGNSIVLNVPDYGYYFVDTTVGTACVIDTVTKNISIAEKNGIPTLDKTVDGETDDLSSADIGQIVEYAIAIDVVKGAEAYKVTDTMSKGLTLLNTSNEAAEKGDTVFTAKAGTEDVTLKDVTFSTNAAGETSISFEIKDVAKYIGKKVVISYSAQVNADALNVDSLTNTASLKYGSSPNVVPITDTVETYTFDFSIQKYKNAVGANNKLSGAKFSVKDGADQISFVKITDGVYRKAIAGETGTVTTIEGDSNGLFTVKGLAAGTYNIYEEEAPTGYNPISGVAGTITITQTGAEGGTADVSYDKNNGIVDVINNTGAVLPSTGATGTIIFITVGGLMVVAMGVLLVVRKRMSKVVYTR